MEGRTGRSHLYRLYAWWKSENCLLFLAKQGSYHGWCVFVPLHVSSQSRRLHIHTKIGRLGDRGPFLSAQIADRGNRSCPTVQGPRLEKAWCCVSSHIFSAGLNAFHWMIQALLMVSPEQWYIFSQLRFPWTLHRISVVISDPQILVWTIREIHDTQKFLKTWSTPQPSTWEASNG